MERPKGLLDDIARHLSKLPGRRTFTVSVLVSQPRRSPASVFPYAPKTHDAEVYIQNVVLLLAEQSSKGQESAAAAAYVSGLEAVLYIFPKSHSVIVYISKVDSTGQGIRPSPTKTLLLAFFEHVSTSWFVSRSSLNEGGQQSSIIRWNIWVQLFARAQNQYLFPASIEFAGKRVLSDIGLVKWWKGVLGEYTSAATPNTEEPTERRHASKFIIVPGLTTIEASHTLRIQLNDTTGMEWIIGHPYSGINIIYPLDVHPPCSISQLIPYFPDDPKARLLDEIANTTTRAAATISSPPSKRRKLDDGEQPIKSTEDIEENETEDPEDTKLDYLRTVSADEFWARMDGRQECRLGTVAFFATYLGTQAVPTTPSSSSTSPKDIPFCRPNRAEVTVAMLRKVTSSLDNHDFGTTEKATHSTEMLQNTIKALAASYIAVTSKIPGVVDDLEEDANAKKDEGEDVVTGYMIRDVKVDNPDLPSKVETAAVAAAPVTVLTARKKKKPPIG